MGLKKVCLLLGLLGFIHSLLLCMVLGKTHYYDFVLQEKNFTKLCETTTILTVNGGFPGPTINVSKGDTFYVNVHNQGTYGVTVHWHGVKQPRNPWSDGPENITQCPIQPGTNFTYEVILSREEGTLWWHAHSDWSRATVHGAIVIMPANGTYPFPAPYADQTIVIASWYKGSVKEVIDEALATGSDPNVSDAFTINGEPGDQYPCSNETTYRLMVNAGKTYLLRIINAVLNEEHFFGIANHRLRVVAQDGACIKPINTSYIMITPGQTMDILVTTNQAPSYYYMASTPFSDGTGVEFDNTTTTAILQYNGNYTPPSSIPFPALPRYNDSNAAENFIASIKSLVNQRVPKNITQGLYITVSVNTLPCPANASCAGPNGDSMMAASLNNVSFETPAIDILEAYYWNITGVFDDDFPRKPTPPFNYTGALNMSEYTATGTKVQMLNYGDEVEIVFQGTNLIAAENHPMHLHGFSFYMVGRGSGNFDKKMSPGNYNLVDPPEINTVGVPKNGWVAIRFFADNPGVWFSHCHLERHSSWGMSTVFIVKNGTTEDTSLLPRPAYMPSCS